DDAQDLLPFPTRRSSDLGEVLLAGRQFFRRVGRFFRSGGECGEAEPGEIAVGAGELPGGRGRGGGGHGRAELWRSRLHSFCTIRSEEHTSAPQSLAYLVC